MDEPLRQTLELLYHDWFRYDELCPRAMWVVELPFHQGEHDPYQWPLRAFFLDHLGMVEKGVFDWRRFYLMQWSSSWHVGQDPPRRTAPKPSVFEVGVGSFTQSPVGKGLSVDLTFGPLYGRGYEVSPEGQLSSIWVS